MTSLRLVTDPEFEAMAACLRDATELLTEPCPGCAHPVVPLFSRDLVEWHCDRERMAYLGEGPVELTRHERSALFLIERDLDPTSALCECGHPLYWDSWLKSWMHLFDKSTECGETPWPERWWGDD